MVDAGELVSQLDSLSTGSLPSPLQIYSMGGLLHKFQSNEALRIRREQPDGASDLLASFQHLVNTFPESYWRFLWSTYRRSLQKLVSTNDHNTRDSWSSADALVTASRSILGLLSQAPQLCRWAYSDDWLALLAKIYDKFIVLEEASVKNDTASATNKDTVLACLSFLILDGLLPNSKDQSSSESLVEEALLTAIQVMEDESTDCLGDLQDWQSRHEPFRRTLESSVQEIQQRKDGDGHEQQREYILNMLETARVQTYNKQSQKPSTVIQQETSSSSKNTSVTSKPVSPTDEMERRIQQVLQILPDLGEGFIETALSIHKGDVEATVGTLLNDPNQYPNTLRVLDRKLPRRKKFRAEDEAREATQARQLVKERVAEEAKQEEARYKALVYVQDQEERQQQQQAVSVEKTKQNGAWIKDEYDDDYDDQYDEIDVHLGGADDGMYDFEQVKLYNQLVRQDEAEGSFWQENRNTNRTNPSNKNNGNKQKNVADDDDEGGTDKQYRGPDKIKGGRIIGPDGRVVRKPGGARKGKGKGGRGGGGGGGGGGAAAAGSGNQTGASNNGSTQGGEANKGKPRTKPKAQNKINRQRDKKQKAQGTFGAQG